MHAKSNRLQIDPPSQNLAGHDPGVKATALASKADTTPVSNVNEAVIADNIKAISNEDVTTLKDIDPLGYFSTLEKNPVPEVNKVQALPTLTGTPEAQLFPKSQLTSDLELHGRNTFTIIRPDLNPPSQQPQRPRIQSNNAFTPPTASSFTSPPTVSPSTLSPTLKANTNLSTTAPSSTTIITTRAEIKAAILEAMVEMKSEIISEMRACMRSMIEDTVVGTKMANGVDDADGVDEDILRQRQN
ncbi:MAG: hypothetical protein Q9198_004524, partial [Flavoplaca austrocitrina]